MATPLSRVSFFSKKWLCHFFEKGVRAEFGPPRMKISDLRS